MTNGFTMPSQALGSRTHNPLHNSSKSIKIQRTWMNPVYNPGAMSGKATKGGLVARPNLLFR